MKIYIVLFALGLYACRTVHKIKADERFANTTEAHYYFDSLSSCASQSNEKKSTEEAYITFEYESSDKPFPQNADTANEIIKTLKSLPAGSKIRKIKGNKNVQQLIQTNATQQFQKKEARDTTHKEISQKKISEKKSETVPIIGLTVLAICMIVAYFLIQKLHHGQNNNGSDSASSSTT